MDAFEQSDTLRSLWILPPACVVSYHFEYKLKEKLVVLSKYRCSPEWETHRILKKLLQEQGTAIATLQGKVNQLMEREGDSEYVHIEASTTADMGE